MNLPGKTLKTERGTEYRVLEACRLCGGAIEEFLDLGETPLANELLDDRDASRNQERFPLRLARCVACGHVQMPVVVDPARLFSSYPYVSGTSPAFVRHLEELADRCCGIGRLPPYSLEPGDLVLEIGSNDGTLLDAFKRRGMRVLGYDPAENLAAAANARGLQTIPTFFTAISGVRVREERGPAKLVVANNVFAHAEDLHDIAEGVRAVLADDGWFVFEVGYLYDMLASGAFDLAYHEHLSFHHVGALAPFLKRHGLHVGFVERIPTQGGSVRVWASKRADVYYRFDEPEGIPRVEPFVKKARAALHRIGKALGDLASSGKTVDGYGCPAKLATLASWTGLDELEIDYVVEDNPLKVGRFVPGTGIPIVSPDRLRGANPPDYVVIFGWNFAEPIIRSWGDVPWHWVVPLPEMRIV